MKNDYKPFYENIDLYEAEYGEKKDDLDFWKQFLIEYKIDSALELGCGTGRIGETLLPFLTQYIGIDTSASFCNLFSEKLSHHEKQNAVLIQDNFLKMHHKFLVKAVIAPFNLFNSFLNPEDFIKALSFVKDHLLDDSYFVIDIINPKTSKHHIEESKMQFVKKINLNGDETVVYECSTYDSIEKINHTVRQYVGTKCYKKYHLPVRLYFHDEIINYLNIHGLHVLKEYGDYSLSPYSVHSDKQIIICSN